MNLPDRNLVVTQSKHFLSLTTEFDTWKVLTLHKITTHIFYKSNEKSCNKYIIYYSP